VNNLKGRNDKKFIATANERLLMYVKSHEFSDKCDFLIIACDGIWDCLTSQEAVSIFANKLQEREEQMAKIGNGGKQGKPLISEIIGQVFD